MDLVTLALAKKYTNQKVNNILSFGGFEIVESLPTSDISHSTVYLLKSSEEVRNIYTEYIYTKNNEWESLGTTIDLEGFITEDNLQEAIEVALTQAKESGEFDGATFTPSVSEDGTLSWTNDKGLDNPESVNIKGEQGEQGADGETPYIKDGNWWIGDTDTGIKAEGMDGADGQDYVLTDTDKTEIAGQAVELIDDMPDYVVTEAESVIDRVIAAQENRTFTFAAITDMHYGNDNYTDGIKHACKALKYIDERIKLDAVAVLGDYTDGYPTSAYANAISDFKDINKILDTLRFGQNLRIQGNHDYYEAHKGEINRFIASYSEGVTWGDITGGYFYKDFDGYKIRVICINTTETANNNNNNIGVSNEQYEWFINSLDLSAKENATDWQILVLSHHPLDWWVTNSKYRFGQIINAYKNGASFSDSEISCNFEGKNSAALIANIHGHIHNLLTDTMYLVNENNTAKTAVYRMSTPNACYGRENQYSNVWKETTTYSKTQNSAKDTAFVIYCINLDTHIIKAICYGAGYDRELDYIIEVTEIVNLLDTVGYTDGMRFSGSNGVEKADSICVATGYIDVSDFESGDHIYGWGVDFNNANNSGKCVIVSYDESKNILGQNLLNQDSNIANLKVSFDSENILDISYNGTPTAKYIRFSGVGTGANAIVTKNQLPIE